MVDDEAFMKLALRLARRGFGRVEPNPMVGCVLVRAGKVIGRGWHKRFGGPHAEVEALRDAGAAAGRGATAYVTLEPCRHHGKTPPCVDALVAAGVKRVVIGVRDPHKTSGGGVALLRRAGIDVALGVGQEDATRLIAPFAKTVTRGLPHVICKWAATIDGAIATRTGESRWISSPESRRLVHRLRACMDAIVVGVGTVIADDPLLTARDVSVRRIARRVVIDPSLRTPMKAKLLRTAERWPVTIAASATAARASAAKRSRLTRMGVEVLALPSRRGRLDLEPLMRHLVDTDAATNVLVEGGSATIGAFIRQALADELVVFIGPRVLGDGASLRPVDAGLARPSIADATGAELVQLRRVGVDAMLRYRL